jgi:hypothetical protein
MHELRSFNVNFQLITLIICTLPDYFSQKKRYVQQTYSKHPRPWDLCGPRQIRLFFVFTMKTNTPGGMK